MVLGLYVLSMIGAGGPLESGGGGVDNIGGKSQRKKRPNRKPATEAEMELAVQAARTLAGECKKITTQNIVTEMGIWSGKPHDKKGKLKAMEKGRFLLGYLQQDGRVKKNGIEWTLVGDASKTPHQFRFPLHLHLHIEQGTMRKIGITLTLFIYAHPGGGCSSPPSVQPNPAPGNQHRSDNTGTKRQTTGKLLFAYLHTAHFSRQVF